MSIMRLSLTNALCVLLLLLLLVLNGGADVLGEAKGPVFPAMFGFGDSIIDTGNNNLLPTIAKCNFPPYGKDFIGHQPTGRFSNGKVPVDLLASSLGIKELLPAYLSPELTSDDLITGVCFASGAAGFDPLTSKLASVISMSDQLGLFGSYKEKLQAIVGDERAEMIVSESVSVVCTGSNDVTNTYYGSNIRRLQYDFPVYVDLLVRLASDFVEGLYNLGARRIAVVGLPPIGCLPSQRTVAGGPQRDCVTLYNEDSEKYNHELSLVLQVLQNKLQGSKIVYIDIYDRFLKIIQHPSDYGFDVSTKGCCGTGELEASILCNNLIADTCDDDSKYIFWDSFHPSQRTYEILVDEIFREDLHRLY